MLAKNVLIIGFQDGFNNTIVEEFRKKYSKVVSISNIEGADIDFWKIHRLELNFISPDLTEDLRDCLLFCQKNFEKFSDTFSRSFYYIPPSHSEIRNYFQILIYYFYQLLKKNNFDSIIYSNIPHESHIYALYLVGNYLKINSAICYQSHIPDRFFVLSEVEDFGNFPDAKKLSPRISELYELPKKWSYMNNLRSEYSYGLKDFFLELIRKPYRFPLATIRLRNGFFYKNTLKNTSHQTVVEKCRFVYFPMQMQPELTTCMLGGEYSDQIFAIEELSFMLPEDVIIILKENPKQTEMERGPYFFKRIRQLKNVKIIHKSYDSRKLIADSLFVAVLNGTAGWEALNLGKPVLIFGNSWYQNFSGVTKFTPTTTFSEVLKRVPNTNSLGVAHSDLMEFAGEGVVDDHYVYMLSNFSATDNAHKVVHSVMNFFGDLP